MYKPDVKYEGQVVKDNYGGFTKIQFEATGYFRLEKTNRWWLVTPDGNAYLSFGLNHVEPFSMKASYNMNYWGHKFGIPVEKRSDLQAYLDKFSDKVKDDFVTIGFNALGCHSDTAFYGEQSPYPYVKNMHFTNLCHYMGPDESEYKDVFSDEFVEHCDAFAKENCEPRKEDKMLIGYSLEDCPLYTDLQCAPRLNTIHGQERDGNPTYPNVLRNLGGQSKGKQAYVSLMKERYATIDDFNQVYYTEFRSFDELLHKANWRRGIDWTDKIETEDNKAFMLKILDKKYEVQKAAIKKYDKNHLLFGDKLDGNTDTPIEFIQLADKYFDLIFYQYYAFSDEHIDLFNEWSKVTDKPFFMGDSSINVATKQSRNPFGPHCEDQNARAEEFTKTFEYLFSKPNYVGWHWCGWMDQWTIAQPGKQHVGIQDAFGKFHDPICNAMTVFSTTMYNIAQRELV